MNDNASRAKCQAGGGPLERRVRHHSPRAVECYPTLQPDGNGVGLKLAALPGLSKRSLAARVTAEEVSRPAPLNAAA